MSELEQLLEFSRLEYMPLLYQARIAAQPLGMVQEDQDECPFSERFLQAIWNERRLVPNLTLSNGTELRILSPGTWNLSCGPDFTSASLLFGDILHTGDVEIHRFASDWNHHHHTGDPLYGHVILHVVWCNDAPPPFPDLPTLVLANHLNPDWKQLLWDLEDACYPYARQVPSGDCALRWAMTSDERVQHLLAAAGLSRFSGKAAALSKLVSDRGQEQAFYECMFDALGYKNNRHAFRKLAQETPLELLQSLPTRLEREALLFGISGLIPDPTRTPVLPDWQDFVSRLWDKWWAYGNAHNIFLDWNNAATRPYNSPFRRLAGGIQILEQTKYHPVQWLLDTACNASTPKDFLKQFTQWNVPDSPWRSLRDFGHAIFPAADLIGRPRFLDLLSNVILPFLAGIADLQDGPESHISKLARNTFLSLPPSQDNRTFKEALQRFLTPPSRVKDLVKSACHQQGMLDIYKNFCLALDNNCSVCPFSQKKAN